MGNNNVNIRKFTAALRANPAATHEAKGPGKALMELSMQFDRKLARALDPVQLDCAYGSCADNDGMRALQVRHDGGTAAVAGHVQKTRLEWAFDDGHYPPWQPDEPKYKFEPKWEITAKDASVSNIERTGQTPEKEHLEPDPIARAIPLQLPPGVAGNLKQVRWCQVQAIAYANGIIEVCVLAAKLRL
jgi:hypothetical protein